ncbi:hypothetical protein KY349_02105, partial [Candidatus Woesearchaeota archaeon]|nr:hypothetical protein [Candidatus Woesearchaeota archaeon]
QDARDIAYEYGNVIDAGLDEEFSNVNFHSTAAPKRNQAYLEIRASNRRLDLFFEDYESALEKNFFRRPHSFSLVFKPHRRYGPINLIGNWQDYKKMCIDMKL